MADNATDQGPSARVRLHITPFNEDLLDRIIPPSIRPLATNISFHAVQTYPERGFGYVELPIMDAQKLKGKLNGTTLKGAKVHIEEAKPERKRKALDGQDAEQDVDKKARKKAKKEKRKQEQGVLPGHELEEGRRVKRGWTDGDAKELRKSKRQAAATSEQDEAGKLLFKTSVPPNMVPVSDETKDKSKKKKDKESKRKKSKTLVQEFSKTKKPHQVSGVESGNHGNLSYEDGKGWVDADGDVVAAERPSRKSKRLEKSLTKEAAIEADAEDEIMGEGEGPAEQATRSVAFAEDEDADATDAAPPRAPVDTPHVSPTVAKEVHPLETLFKRPVTSPTGSAKPRPTPIDTSFSFFDPNNADEDDEEGADMPPQTPHTRRDLEWRSIRSAAPTPDTAAIGRKFSFPFPPRSEEDDEDEDEEMKDAEQAQPGASKEDGEGKGEETGFRKWFYEHRGDFNRGWKKRRREEKKQKRQRENRRLSQKIA